MSRYIDSTPGSDGGGARGARWALWSTLAVVAACGSAVTESPSQSGYSTGSGGSTTSTGSTTTSTGSGPVEGLPCAIAELLTAKCISCHSKPPLPNIPSSLTSYADLTAPSKGAPTKSAAVVALARMKSATSPMPPSGTAPPSAAEIAAFEAWVNAGTPMGTCSDVDGGTNPFDAPAQCTSMTQSTDKESNLMNPGEACIKCHLVNADSDQQIDIGGTAYATPHEPDNCIAKVETGPAITTAVVEITDKHGNMVPYKVNSVGNFGRLTGAGVTAGPYTAKIKHNGVERVMVAPQTSGDCNSCHTQAGANKAPGRILLP